MIKFCVNCYIEFNTIYDYQKYCCEKCQSKYRNKSLETEKICLVCDLKFKSSIKKYCSRKCSKIAEHRRSRNSPVNNKEFFNKIEKKCVSCNNIFMDFSYSKRIYCSAECSRQFHKNQLIKIKNENPIVATCINCNQEFILKRITDKYCTEQCRDSFNLSEVIYKKICFYCNKEFETKLEKKKCCSAKCTTKLWSKNNKVLVAQKNKDKYEKNKNKHIEMVKINNTKRRVKLKEFIKRIKLKFPCKDCQIKFTEPSIMEFDHVKGNKICDISKMVSLKVSIEILKQEIRKCDLVCANCHRIRTANRRKNDKNPK